MELKDGSVVEDPRLDRLVQFDPKSRLHPVMATLPAEASIRLRSYTWGLTEYLDQGTEGRCTEFSICHEMLARPVRVNITKIMNILAQRAVYHEAQHDDYWDGCYLGPDCNIMPSTQKYEGTSVLAAVKVAAKLGFYSAYDWAFGLDELVPALGYRGPALLGINWYGSMFRPDENGWLRVTGEVAGGHAILARGVRVVYKPKVAHTWENLDMDKSYVLLHNSWGPSWGINGTGKVSFADMDRLLKEQGECCLPRTRVL